MSDDLVSRLRQDAEMLQDGPQSNLTKLWHSEVVKDAAKDCQEAATALTEARAEIAGQAGAIHLLGERCAQYERRAEKAESALAEARKVIEPIVSRLEWDGHMQRWALAPDMPAGSITAARRFIASQEPAEQEK